MKGISVIIPVYNTEKYIVDCLESVLANDFQEYEIICVNDGSTDSSLELINELAEKHNCIKVISQENKGQSSARNKGMQIATGKYLYFLDSDDKISSNALGELYSTLEQNNLDVIYFSGNSFYDSKQLADEFEQFATVYLREGSYEGCCNGLELLKQLRNQGDYSVSPCIQIVRKQFLIENNIFFQEGIIHEDNLFSFKVIFNAKRAKCVNDIYFYRRIRESSVMTTKKTYKNLLGYYICFFNILNYVYNNEFEKEYEDVIADIISALKWHVHRNYLAIDDEQRKLFLNKLSEKERIYFFSVIRRDVETEVKLKEEMEERNRKLQQTYAEKSELNKKLQQTYEEKSELNRKLQITYDEKFERGIQIKQLKVKNRELNDELRKKEEQLNEIYNKLPIRIYRKIKMWFKRLFSK